MKWIVVSAYDSSPNLRRYLDEGYEPFAVVPTPNGRQTRNAVYLRKLIPDEEER